jgi:hypothetical protein
MHGRVIRRAVAATFSLLIAASLIAYADTVPVDGDSITPGNQTLIDLGSASPGDILIRQVTLRLECAGVSHATPGSTISVTYEGGTVPGEGLAEATDVAIGPVPANWAADGCTSPAQTLAANGPSTVTLTMPTTPGPDQEFTLSWSRNGSGGLTGMTTITFVVDVIGNTPPTLHLPDDKIVEATSAAGADVSWTATATDNEDATPPAVTCSPASGSTFPLGTTKVSCSATDDGRLTTKGSFLVTVQDTTAPRLADRADIGVTTNDPSGASVDYGNPNVVEAVDPHPTTSCGPIDSGGFFPVGTTTITCTSRDASGNEGSTSFKVTVKYVPPVTWSAIWGEPVASTGATFVANSGRTVPVKVRIFANDTERTSGEAALRIATCSGAPAATIAMAYSGGRWNASVSTGTLGGPGCYIATASLGGNDAGSFRLDLRGTDVTPTSSGPRGNTKP